MDDTIPQDIPQRKCTGRCQQVKPLTDFYGWIRKKRDGTRSKGYQSRCKLCISEENKGKPNPNKERDKERKRTRRREGRIKPVSPEVNRKWDLRTYRMTIQDYDAMVVAQKGVCAICKKPETTILRITQSPRRLCVDHCHETGKIRALLCDKCNRMLGCAKDDCGVLLSAVEYLRSYSK